MKPKNKKSKEALQNHCNCKGEQNKAANTLKGVSPGIFSHIPNDKWNLGRVPKWQTISSQVGSVKNAWISVETVDYKLLIQLLADAQKNSHIYAITASAGSGKTYALRHYTQTHPNAYMVQCNEFWNRKAFMSELLKAMGRDYSGFTINEMVMEVVHILKCQEAPIILLDEFDKVSDQVLYFFITLYNLLEEQCAIVMSATDHLEKRIKRGLKLNKKGYKEIYSRIGRRFIELNGLTQADVIQVCHANSIEDRQSIKKVWKECECDLRRVKRKIHALKLELSGN